MNPHRRVDWVGVRHMWRYRRPPVDSTVDDLERLAAGRPEELHPPVAPAELTLVGSRALPRPRGVPGVPRIVEDHYSFPSPSPWGIPELDTAFAVRWRREGARAAGRVALVVAHGAYTAALWKPLLFVPRPERAGWDTWLLELPEHLRRQRPQSRYSGEFMVTADVGRITRSISQTEAELRALSAGLGAMGYERVVLLGISIGGSPVMQALVRTGDEVAGAVGIVPSVDAYMGLWESLLGQGLRPAGHAAGITDDLARRVLAHITPRLLGRPRVGPDRILLAYGRHDLVCRPQESLDLSRAWGGCTLRDLGAGHSTVLMIYPRIRRMVGAWMRRLVPECAED